mmetsp:Transcript_1369/g.3960  ORF Transcript_1369/g.3960 Transcript_1369/m.3960 type:complete len:203 (+) Transcript_1369:965-1573(+)
MMLSPWPGSREGRSPTAPSSPPPGTSAAAHAGRASERASGASSIKSWMVIGLASGRSLGCEIPSRSWADAGRLPMEDGRQARAESGRPELVATFGPPALGPDATAPGSGMLGPACAVPGGGGGPSPVPLRATKMASPSLSVACSRCLFLSFCPLGVLLWRARIRWCIITIANWRCARLSISATRSATGRHESNGIISWRPAM